MAGKGMYCIVANDATVGATIGTFDAINTRNADIRLREGATSVVGLVFSGVANTQTTATAVMARLRVNSTDAAISNEDFAVGETHGGGIATQSMAWFSPAEWIAVDWPAMGGNVFNLSFSQMGIEPADQWSVQAGIAHVAGVMPPAKWFDAAMVGGTLPHQGSRSSDGGSTTDARTSLGSTTIPARFTQMVSGRWLQAQDAVPANGEESTAFVEVTSTIGDFSPQEYPTNSIGAALAGTLVGGGVWGFQPSLPFYITKTPVTETVEPFVDILTAITAANAFGYSLGLRF
jgi:hypothetical protein